MRHIDENNDIHIKKAIEIINEILYGINSMIEDYANIYSTDEMNILKSTKTLFQNFLNQSNYKYENIINLLKLEDGLKFLAYRSWEYELKNGYYIVSWLKDDSYSPKPFICSTLNSDDNINNFCESGIGIQYEINEKSYIGASIHDGGTYQSTKLKNSIYTIGDNGTTLIDSYNLATPIITPKQLLTRNKNEHSEIILDRRFVKEKNIIYLYDVYKNDAIKLANMLNLNNSNIFKKEICKTHSK